MPGLATGALLSRRCTAACAENSRRNKRLKRTPIIPILHRRPGSTTTVRSCALAFAPSCGFIFGVATVGILPCYCLLLARPASAAVRSDRLASIANLAAGGLYVGLLAAWLPGPLWDGIAATFASCSPLPNMQLLADLLRQPRVTVLAWIHLLMLDFYQARHVVLDGCKRGVFTAHSVVLCFMCGPLGLLSHLITRRLVRNRRGAAPDAPLQPT